MIHDPGSGPRFTLQNCTSTSVPPPPTYPLFRPSAATLLSVSPYRLFDNTTCRDSAYLRHRCLVGRRSPRSRLGCTKFGHYLAQPLRTPLPASTNTTKMDRERERGYANLGRPRDDQGQIRKFSPTSSDKSRSICALSFGGCCGGCREILVASSFDANSRLWIIFCVREVK